MSDLRKTKRKARDWQAHLTPEERKRIGEIDRALDKMQKKANPLRWERHAIQNRASVRAGLADKGN